MKYDNSKVRRQDRLMDEQRAMELLREGEYGFLALGGEGAYCVPMSYALEGDSLWFHCAPEGEKLDRIARDDSAVFCVVGKTAVQSARFTTLYESVMAKGKIEIVKDTDAMIAALGLLLDKYCAPDKVAGTKYAQGSMPRTAILRLRIEQVSGKKK